MLHSWALRFSLDPSEREAFSSEETEWLKSLEQRCALPARTEVPMPPQARACVLDAYTTRAAKYAARLKGDALAEANLSPQERFEIQESLVALGFLDGEPDGEFGPITRRAIRSFLASIGMPEAEFLSADARQTLSRSAPKIPVVRQNSFPGLSRQSAPGSQRPAALFDGQ